MNDYAPTRLAQEIVGRLRGLIARYDVSQVQLAALCDVSQSQFSKMIRGVRPMSIDHVAVLCDALGESFTELVEESENFIMERDLGRPSPVLLVDDGERLLSGLFRAEDDLDAWAVRVRQQLDLPGSVIFGVGGSGDDVDLSAMDDSALRSNFDLAANKDETQDDIDPETTGV